jgi:membrane protein YdbS with pleckstrin-like domain
MFFAGCAEAVRPFAELGTESLPITKPGRPIFVLDTHPTVLFPLPQIMRHENPAIPPADMPRYADVPLQPVEPAFKKVLYISWSIAYILTLAVIAFLYLKVDALHSTPYLLAALCCWLCCAALTVAAIEIGFRNKAWALRERDIVFRKGWLFQSTHIIPFVKIQHCVVRSGPIERGFGLASIWLMTAAGTDLDIGIRGLKQETAESLKQWIVEKTAAHARPGV